MTEEVQKTERGPRRAGITPEQEAEVIRLTIRGERASVVSKKVGVSYGIVAQMQRNVAQEIGIVGGTILQHRIAEYLDATLEAQIVQQQIFGDPAWLAKQSAADLARLHTTLQDNTIRLLEAVQRAGLNESSDAGRAHEQRTPIRRVGSLPRSGSEDSGGAGETPSTPTDGSA